MTGEKNCVCLECEKPFYLPPCRIRMGKGIYCSRKCQHKSLVYREKNRVANLGQTRSDATKLRIKHSTSGKNHPNWGKHLSESTKEKIRQSNLGKIRSKDTREKIRASHIGLVAGEKHYLWGKHPSDKTRQKQSEAHIGIQTGENHPMWKKPEDRITILNTAIRKSDKYKKWISNVFKRDDFTCQLCNIKGALEAHHIKPLHQIIKENNIKSLEDARDCYELWNLMNGLTLCKRCHGDIPTHATFESQGIKVLTYPDQWGL